ncbi:serine/threonine-protein kinase bud32 [Ceratocystis pirilliformis]|uniref:EKC/KEOPS complex subunit BUD32 n=1 Tax=Ceratocystis pirilliformis TaxID=259994 RepID=A0ABR3YSU9_9PEZI
MTTQFEFPLPKCLEYPASAPPTLITQGAEGRLYKSTFVEPTLPCAVKHRPSKPYRHPLLDKKLTRARILAEARILAKCLREGVLVPAVYAVDEHNGCLTIEWIEGAPVRVRVNEWLATQKAVLPPLTENVEAAVMAAEMAQKTGLDAELRDVFRRMGFTVGSLHRVGIVHGDLTTSNMMLRQSQKQIEEKSLRGEVVAIDFGLASQSSLEEDRAVDLYVLEKSIGSSHPRAEHIFPEVLEGYKQGFKQAAMVLKRLEDVRLRGRKRSMIG